MSTQINTYVMYGAIRPYTNDDAVRKRMEEYEDSAFAAPRPFDQVTVLVDGMDGAYIAVGYVYARTEDGQGFPHNISLPVSSATYDTHVRAAITDLYPLGDGEALRIGWHVITHHR